MTMERRQQSLDARRLSAAQRAALDGLAPGYETLHGSPAAREDLARREYRGRRGDPPGPGDWITETLADGSIRQTRAGSAADRGSQDGGLAQRQRELLELIRES
jgi:hypothetical protein